MFTQIRAEIQEFNMDYKRIKNEVWREIKEEHPESGLFERVMFNMAMSYAKIMLIIRIIKGGK